MPSLDSLPPEVLTAFYGPHPLLAAQSLFPSRPALLNAYADSVRTTFALSTAQHAACDICQSTTSPADCLHVHWNARSRWIRRGLIIRSLTYPVAVPLLLILHHIGLGGFLIDAINTHAPYQESIAFSTAHPICPACARRFRTRRVLYTLARYACLTLGLLAFAFDLVVGIIIGPELFRPNLNPTEFLIDILVIAIPLLLMLTTGILLRTAVPRILLPRSLNALVKSPFRRTLCELHPFTP